MRCLNCRQTAENPCCSLPFPHNAHPASTRPVFDHLYSETACNQSILTSFSWELLYTLTLPAKHSQGVRLTEQVLMEVFGSPRIIDLHWICWSVICVFLSLTFSSPINLIHIDATQQRVMWILVPTSHATPRATFTTHLTCLFSLRFYYFSWVFKCTSLSFHLFLVPYWLSHSLEFFFFFNLHNRDPRTHGLFETPLPPPLIAFQRVQK